MAPVRLSSDPFLNIRVVDRAAKGAVRLIKMSSESVAGNQQVTSLTEHIRERSCEVVIKMHVDH